VTYHKETTVEIRPAVLGQSNYDDLNRRLRSGELDHIWAWAKQYLHYTEVLPDHQTDGWIFLRQSACGKRVWDFGRIIGSEVFDPLCATCLKISKQRKLAVDDV
jgi:hypothetical protein